MEGARWIYPERGSTWTYWHPKLGVLGMVWRDLDLYMATGPKEVEEDYHHGELGGYGTLREAQDIVEGVADGSIELSVSRPRDFGTLRGGRLWIRFGVLLG